MTTPSSSTPTRSRAPGSASGASAASRSDGVPVDEDVSAIMDDTIAALEDAGATIVDPADIPFAERLGATPSSRRSCASSRTTSRPTWRRTPAPATRRRFLT